MKQEHTIIGHLYAQGLIQSECAKVCKDVNLCGDLTSEVTIILMGKNPDLIEGLNERGEILYYIHRIAKNLYYSKTSPFYHKYVEFQSRANEYDTTL